MNQLQSAHDRNQEILNLFFTHRLIWRQSFLQTPALAEFHHLITLLESRASL
jgi:hypothetical protein